MADEAKTKAPRMNRAKIPDVARNAKDLADMIDDVDRGATQLDNDLIYSARRLVFQLALDFEMKAPADPDQLSPSEAVYGVLGWLTSQPNPVTFSSKHEAGTAAMLAGDFCALNHLAPPREDWSKNLVYPMKPIDPTTDAINDRSKLLHEQRSLLLDIAVQHHAGPSSLTGDVERKLQAVLGYGEHSRDDYVDAIRREKTVERVKAEIASVGGGGGGGNAGTVTSITMSIPAIDPDRAAKQFMESVERRRAGKDTPLEKWRASHAVPTFDHDPEPNEGDPADCGQCGTTHAPVEACPVIKLDDAEADKFKAALANPPAPNEKLIALFPHPSTGHTVSTGGIDAEEPQPMSWGDGGGHPLAGGNAAGGMCYVGQDVDYTALSSGQLIHACGDDASKWSTAFCQHAKKLGVACTSIGTVTSPRARPLDEGWVTGWFANAIMKAIDLRTPPVRSVDELEDRGERSRMIAEIDRLRNDLASAEADCRRFVEDNKRLLAKLDDIRWLP
jgi:hypothetical protein